MNTGTGVILLLAGSLSVLGTGIFLRPKLPRAAASVLLAISGAAIGAGALGVRDGASPAEWVLTLVVLAMMAPLQVRLVFGRSGGTENPSSGTVGRDRKR